MPREVPTLGIEVEKVGGLKAMFSDELNHEELNRQVIFENPHWKATLEVHLHGSGKYASYGKIEFITRTSATQTPALFQKSTDDLNYVMEKFHAFTGPGGASSSKRTAQDFVLYYNAKHVQPPDHPVITAPRYFKSGTSGQLSVKAAPGPGDTEVTFTFPMMTTPVYNPQLTFSIPLERVQALFRSPGDDAFGAVRRRDASLIDPRWILSQAADLADAVVNAMGVTKGAASAARAAQKLRGFTALILEEILTHKHRDAINTSGLRSKSYKDAHIFLNKTSLFQIYHHGLSAADRAAVTAYGTEAFITLVATKAGVARGQRMSDTTLEPYMRSILADNASGAKEAHEAQWQSAEDGFTTIEQLEANVPRKGDAHLMKVMLEFRGFSGHAGTSGMSFDTIVSLADRTEKLVSDIGRTYAHVNDAAKSATAGSRKYYQPMTSIGGVPSEPFQLQTGSTAVNAAREARKAALLPPNPGTRPADRPQVARASSTMPRPAPPRVPPPTTLPTIPPRAAIQDFERRMAEDLARRSEARRVAEARVAREAEDRWLATHGGVRGDAVAPMLPRLPGPPR